MEACEELEFIEEDIESSDSSSEEEKEIPVGGNLQVAGFSTVKQNSLQLSPRISTTTQVFETFENVDIHTMTFQSLVETLLLKRRDLTENGIYIMLTNKNM